MSGEERLFEGGCGCSAVRYRVRARPKFQLHCQCRRCQQGSGTGHASILVVPVAELVLEGALRFWDYVADSGNKVSRGFCPTCGSPIMNRNGHYTKYVYLMAGSLDDPNLFEPAYVHCRDAALAWDHMDPSLD